MRVAMFLDNSFTMDERVFREARSVASFGHDLTVYALEDKFLMTKESRDNYNIERIFTNELFSVRNKVALKKTIQVLIKEKFDVIHCHDHYMLQIGAIYKKHYPDCKLIYDSHELFKDWPIHLMTGTGFFLNLKTRIARYFDIRREKNDAKKIDYLITVNSSLANILAEYFHLKNKPVVLRNILEFEKINEKSDYLRKEFLIPNNTKVLIYMGLYLFRKKLNENSLLQLGNSPNLALVIIASKDRDRKYFEDLVKRNGIHNIYFKDLIKREQFIPVMGSADVGLVSTWNKKSLSYWLALDNKIFTYIMCELPILATAQPEYMNIIEKNEIGVCVDADKPNAFREGWEKLLIKYDIYKSNVKKLKPELTWEKEELKLKELYNHIQQSLI